MRELPDRRLVVSAILAGPFFLVPAARAQQLDRLNIAELDPDPTGAIRAIQTITAIIELTRAITGSSGSGRELNRRLKEINQKLDIIISYQQQILREIEQLKLYIDEALWLAFRKDNEFDLRVLTDEFREVTGANRTNRYEPLAIEIQRVTNKAGLYDFGALFTFLTGVAMSLALHRLNRTGATQLALIKQSYREKLEGWLDVESQRSVTHGLRQLRLELTAAQASIIAYPRKFTLHEWTKKEGSERCTYRETLTLSGNMDSGFIGSVAIDRMWCVDGRSGGGMAERGGNLLRILPSPIGNALPNGVSALHPDYSDIPAPIERTTGYPQVDEINRRRNVWITLLRRQSDLKFIEVKIRETLSILA